MSESPTFGEITFELGQFLRRAIWQPLHRLTEIFHLLPAAAAAILLLLLAYVGQLREIYLSYLEDLDGVRIGAALAGFALISAALYKSHYWLSTMRINVVYSHLAYPNAGSRLRNFQQIAAFAWSLFPWAGLAAGLFLARTYLVDVNLQDLGGGATIAGFHTLPSAGTSIIVLSVLFLGLVIGRLFNSYRKSRIVQAAIILSTPTAAAAVFLLLTGIYPQIDTIPLVAIVLIAVTASFYGIHYLLDTRRMHFIYSGFLRADTGINPRRRQRLATFGWAVFPWLAVGFYFSTIEGLSPRLGNSMLTLPRVADWAVIPVAVIIVVAVGLLLAQTMDKFRQTVAMRTVIVSAIALPIIAAAMMPSLGLDLIQDDRSFGPLGSMALAYLFIFSSFALLALLSQKSGFPAVTLAWTAPVLSVLFHISIGTVAWWLCCSCCLFVLMALVSRLWAVALVAGLLGALAFCTVWREKHHDVQVDESSIRSNDVPSLESQFDKWLADRRDRGSDPKKPYLVFIISVEGGGIYAGAAASLLLAKLQDDCPAFAQHLFAISGVSGGAIGATIFQALAQFLPQSQTADCHPADRDGWLTHEVTAIMEDDHFSPVVASIIPDLLGERTGRAEALEQSFEHFNDPEIEYRLKQPFLSHWRYSNIDQALVVSGAAPALVLNTTWAETGYRVAFAPFTLNSSKANDGTLYSFADRAKRGDNMPDEDMPGENIALMNAAVASARFPGILPPYSVRMPDDHRWSFVDGGYSDNSGAATALALFTALKPSSCDKKVDLRVIILTGVDQKRDFKTLNGTDFRDTMAPIDAVMKVRELLSNQAVTRASDYIEHIQPCPQFKSDWRLREIKLQEERFSLPLGWKISKTTFDVISSLIGRPRYCVAHDSSNSCVMRDIEEALSAK